MAEYFAIGTTLAGLVNVETLIDAPQVLDAGRIPSLPPVKTRGLDAVPKLDGWINSRWIVDATLDTQRIAFNTAAYGDQVTAGRRMFISSLDDMGFYSPYYAVIDRALEAVDYMLARGGVYVRGMQVGLYDCLIQYATKTGNFTVTTSDHYLQANTAGGSITFTLPALSGVNAGVVFSFHKTSASNNMVIAKAAGDGGGTYATLTDNGARIDIASIDGAWRTIRLGSML